MLDHLYRQAMRARRAWYARPGRVRHLDAPVIAVGNLSVGGTGKTPLVAALAARLLEGGERPAILSRGYGRRRAQGAPLVVSDGVRILAAVDEAGDEPALLAHLVPGAVIVVGADRHASGRLAERTLGATFHVLDDGFQHVQLARDVDVIVTTPGEITGGRVLPFGRLREGAEAASRADVLVVVGATAAAAATEAAALGVPHACGAARVPGRATLVGPAPSVPVDLERLRAGGGRAVAVAGIAHPERFFDGLDAEGWTVAARLTFGDHHWYSATDVARIAAAARVAHAEVVLTTGKDAVKLERLAGLPCPLAQVPMRLEVDPADAIDAWIALTRARRNARPTGDGR